MSLDLPPDQRPLTSTEDLLAFFHGAERPVAELRVGLEHEKMLYTLQGGVALPYAGPVSVEAVLQGFTTKGYRPFRESPDGPVIALQNGALSVSLEPGGQFELSGSPTRTAREAHAENLAHLKRLVDVCEPLGVVPVALGYRPFGTPAEMPWMPKSRYGAMRRTLGARGALALDMMLMTATGQVSLDWSNEADCARKVTAAARLTPVLVALFANSPLVRGRPSGYQSYRSHVWTQVDPARCGYFPRMLDGSFSYRAYVEWALEAPLLFLRRDGGYLTPPMTFGQLLREGFGGKPAVLADWVDHLSTLFPEVRIKRVLELRGADCVPATLTGALVAVARGLFYSPQALGGLLELLPSAGLAQHLEDAESARRMGLRASLSGRKAADLAREVVRLARMGLKEVDPFDAPLLDPLEALAASGRSRAESVLAAHEEGLAPGELLARFVALA